MNMQTLINQANASRQPGKSYAAAFAELPFGSVSCYRDYSIYKRGMPHHARTTWKLNGKTISADNLNKLFNAE
jgi:hypothetical protein